MKLFKRLLEEETTLLRLELSVTGNRNGRIFFRDPEDDFDIMLACILFYTKILSRLAEPEKTALTDHFSSVGKNESTSQNEITCLYPEQEIKSGRKKIIIRLIESRDSGKTVRFSAAGSSLQGEYAILFFKLTLDNISLVYRHLLINAFLILTEKAARQNLAEKQLADYSQELLHGLFQEVA